MPAVRHIALRLLVDEPEDAPAVRRARAKAMRVPPISTILEHQAPQGWWERPGRGYGRKYTGTVWSVISWTRWAPTGATGAWRGPASTSWRTRRPRAAGSVPPGRSPGGRPRRPRSTTA